MDDLQRVIEMIKMSPKTKRQIAQELGIPEQRLYAWLNKGAKPSYRDIQMLIKYFGLKTEIKDYDSEIVVLMDRVAEILAKIRDTSATVERSSMLRDVQKLKEMKSSS